NNSTFLPGAAVTISATATSEGAVTSVDFKDGPNLIASDSTAPYSITTSTLTLGTHTITAVSHDSLGNTHTSPSITITIAANSPPVISSVLNNLNSDHAFVGV